MIEPFGSHRPVIHPTAYVHPAATLVGEVHLEAEASVWPSVSMRGDEGPIVLGARSNLQDGCVCHDTGGRSQTRIGEQVTVGHGVILHGCRIGHDSLIGMGSILMDDVEIAPFTVVGAGSLIPPGKRFPGGVLVLGRPAQVVRELTDAERDWIAHSWQEYVRLARAYRARDAEGGS